MGAFSATPVSAAFSAATRCASRNTGDSLTASRTNMPTRISTADSRNGMRQPHAANASSDWNAASSARTPVASRLPGGSTGLRPGRPEAAVLGLAVLGDQQHRAAPLAAQREALDEPEGDQQDRREDADRPKVGSRPIANVAPPIISREMTSSFLRPIRSPKWPKTRAPIGRAAKPTA